MPRGHAGPENPDPLPCAERILGLRDHGREELRRKLLARGYDPGAVDEVLDGLSERGLLDDSRFAREFARQSLEKGHGELYVRVKLGARGLRGAQALCTPAEEAASLRAFLGRRGIVAGTLTGASERAKMLRFLRGRGYSGAAIGSVLGRGAEFDEG
jgi:regulatory protein